MAQVLRATLPAYSPARANAADDADATLRALAQVVSQSEIQQLLEQLVASIHQVRMERNHDPRMMYNSGVTVRTELVMPEGTWRLFVLLCDKLEIRNPFTR